MPDVARLLFVTLTNDVGADRVVSDLGSQGAACAVLGPPGNFPGLSRWVDRHFDLPGRFGTWAKTRMLRRRLVAAVCAWRPDRVVPLDELAALLLRTIARRSTPGQPLHDLLVTSFGDPAGYHAACHRLALMRLAAAAGVRTPAFGSASDALTFPLVVKRDHSSGSGGVAIVPEARCLPAVLRKAGLLTGIKRLMARAAGYDHGPAPLLLQQFVPGTLAMRTVVTDRGRVVDGASFRAVQSHPEKRASTVLEPLDCPEMSAAADRLAAALGCSGFVSFDFMIDPGGAAFLIEMNPRPIGSTHLGRLFGHDLARAFLTGRAAGEAGAPSSPVRSVALFPKELERDPGGERLDADRDWHHDVPWAEPRLVEAYSRHLQHLHPAHAAAIGRRLGQTAPAEPANVAASSARLSGATP